MAFDQRAAVPLSPTADPLLPQADSSQGHDIPTGVSPTTAKLQDWIAFLNEFKVNTYNVRTTGPATSTEFTWNDIASSAFQNSTIVLDIPSCVEDDVLMVTMSGNFRTDHTTAGYSQVRLLAIDDYGGVAGSTDIGGTADLYSAAAGIDRHGGVSLVGRHVVAMDGTSRIMVQASVTSGASNSVFMTGNYSISVTRVRL